MSVLSPAMQAYRDRQLVIQRLELSGVKLVTHADDEWALADFERRYRAADETTQAIWGQFIGGLMMSAIEHIIVAEQAREDGREAMLFDLARSNRKPKNENPNG